MVISVFTLGLQARVPQTAILSLTRGMDTPPETPDCFNQGLLSSFQDWIFVGQPNLVMYVLLLFSTVFILFF